MVREIADNAGDALANMPKVPLIAVITLLGGLAGGGTFSFVSQQDLFTEADWAREKEVLMQFAEAQHGHVEARVKTEIGQQIKQEMSALRSEISSSRDRMDKLIDSNSRMSALVEQYVLYQRTEYQKRYKDPAQSTP